MALQFDNRLYSGGATTFDSRPHTALYINLLQRKAAQEEAFDEYLRNLNKSVNSAGLRNVDRPAFEKKLADWQKFNIQNRNAIKNPRTDQGNAALQSQAGYQDLMNLVAESKQEEEKKKPLIDILTDPAKRDRLNEDAIGELHAHDQPLYLEDGTRNPNRKSFDISLLNFNAKPFEQDKYFKQFEDVKRTDLPPSIVKNPKDMTQTVTTTSVFDPEAKDLIATRAVSDYMNNKSFKEFVDKLNPWEYNDFYKQNFGHDIHSAADLAAAYTLKGMQQKVVKSELKDDVFARQKAMEAIRTANDKELIRFRKSIDPNDTELNNLWVDRYIEQITNDARSKPENLLGYKFAGGKKQVQGYKIEIDPVLEKALGFDSKNQGQLLVTPDGKFIRSFYKTDDAYKPQYDDKGNHLFDATRTGELTQDQIKLALGKKSVTPTQLNKEMLGNQGAKKSTYSIKGKTYTEDQLLKMGYTIDQIAPYKK